jgi:hypothetical protein
MTGASGFSGKRRKTIRRVAEGAWARDVDRIVSKVIEALETRSTNFSELLSTRPGSTRLERVRQHPRSFPNRFHHRSGRLDSEREAEESLALADFDAAASFEAEVREFARAAADLADERRATVVALAEISARGDRIDRLQGENRSALDHLQAF